MATRMKKIEPKVEEVLREDESCRGDDFLLCNAVYKKFIDTNGTTFEEACVNHIAFGLPSFASIVRCRRKLQVKYPELVDPKSVDARLEQEEEVLDYVRDKED